jgi:hypothetical protein
MNDLKKSLSLIALICTLALSCSAAQRLLLEIAGVQGQVDSLTHIANPVEHSPIAEADLTPTPKIYITPTAGTTTPDCTDPNSTSDQCPQVGTRHFTITTCNVTEYSGRNCSCGYTEGTIDVSDDQVLIQYDAGGKQTFKKQGQNQYTETHAWGESNLSISTLTLNDNGFHMITETYDTSDNTLICKFEKTGIFGK